MGYSLRDRIAFWLERWEWTHGLLLKYDGIAPSGVRYTNRINGHVVVKEP